MSTYQYQVTKSIFKKGYIQGQYQCWIYCFEHNCHILTKQFCWSSNTISCEHNAFRFLQTIGLCLETLIEFDPEAEDNIVVVFGESEAEDELERVGV